MAPYFMLMRVILRITESVKVLMRPESSGILRLRFPFPVLADVDPGLEGRVLLKLGDGERDRGIRRARRRVHSGKALQGNVEVHPDTLLQGKRAHAARLVAAGATLVETVHREGFDMTMLRDPFGIAVQFVKRAKSILL